MYYTFIVLYVLYVMICIICYYCTYVLYMYYTYTYIFMQPHLLYLFRLCNLMYTG